MDAVVDSSSLAVAGLLEVAAHIPRIYLEYRKLLRAARERRPDAAILTDSPDFHLRLAKRLKRLGIPVVYLVAPQVWAWRKGRLPAMRRAIDRLLCIFPFEPAFFHSHGIAATYIGHPLYRIVRPSAPAAELRRHYGIPEGTPFIALLPGSRTGEMLRHLPRLLDAVERIQAVHPARFALSLPAGFGARAALTKFEERFRRLSIQISEGETWDLLACSDLALAASGTVTVEAALIGVPMVVFYRVRGLSWLLGKMLVRVPFYSMVNILAGRLIVPELIQDDFSAPALAAEALRLLDSPELLAAMRAGLHEVSGKLAGDGDPMEAAAAAVAELIGEKECVHA